MLKQRRHDYIMSVLMDGKTYTRAQFARYCDCSEKQIQRDIKYLSEIYQFPIEGGNQGYYLRAPSKAESKVTENKLLASLLIAGGSIDKRFEQMSPAAALSIKNHLYKLKDMRTTWDAAKLTVKQEETSFSELELETFGRVARHILMQLPLEFDYRPLMSDSVERRSVHPIQLREREGFWYLLAHDYGRKACRVFAISRISKLSTSTEQHDEPSEEVIQAILKRGDFSIWDKDGEDKLHIKVKLVDYAARIIQERKIHESQQLDIISANEVILTLKTSDQIGVNLWLRKFAPMVTVLSPQSLRQDFIHDLKQSLANHKPTSA